MAIQRNAFTMPAGGFRDFDLPADFVYFESVGAGDASGQLGLVFNQNQNGQSAELQPKTSYLFGASSKLGFKKVTFQNRAGIAVAVVMIAGDGTFSPGAGGAQVQATIIGTPDVNIASIAAGLNPANAIPVKGGAASGAAPVGNPELIAGEARTSDRAVSGNGLVLVPMFDKIGRQVVVGGALPENALAPQTAAITTTAPTTLIAALGAGIRASLDSLTLANDSAVATLVTISDGTTSRIVNMLAQFNLHLTFPTPLRGQANTAWTVTCGTTASSIRVGATGFSGA